LEVSERHLSSLFLVKFLMVINCLPPVLLFCAALFICYGKYPRTLPLDFHSSLRIGGGILRTPFDFFRKTFFAVIFLSWRSTVRLFLDHLCFLFFEWPPCGFSLFTRTPVYPVFCSVFSPFSSEARFIASNRFHQEFFPQTVAPVLQSWSWSSLPY